MKKPLSKTRMEIRRSSGSHLVYSDNTDRLLHIGDEVSGTAWTKKYPKLEYAEYYRAGALKKTKKAVQVENEKNPPWTDEAPALSVYDWRGN